jgi:type I restriction enzyme S subunit
MIEWKKLGEVCTFNRGRTITAKDAENGEIPVIAGGQAPSYYHNEANRNGESITVAGSGAYAGFISYWNQPIFVSDAFTVDPNRELGHRYLFYWLKMNQTNVFAMQKGAGVPHVHGKDIANFIIPIPSLAEQQRIVGILDTFTASIDNLKEQIAQRRKQYEYFRDQLLDLEGKEGVEMKTLGEISTFSQGIQVPLENQSLANKEGYFRFLRIIDFTQGNEPPRYVPISDKRYWISSDEIAIVRYGTPGFVCRGLEGILANNMFKVIIKDKGLLGNSFLSSLLKSKIFQTPIKQKSSGGALQAISFGLIKDISVPVPPLQEQQRIVSILDTFEASIQNLEAQLSQREKQYEYYRNKLLTFE